MIKVEADLGAFANYNGMVAGFTQEIKTDKFKRAMVEHLHFKMMDAFNVHIDAFAIANRLRLWHMYEWRRVGDPSARLWEPVKRGRGGTIITTIQFKPSKTFIPDVEERSNNPNDPVSKWPSEMIQRMSNKKYVFYNKAYVMENNIEITIRPRTSSGRLIIPNQNAKWGFYMLPKGKSATVRSPGGQNTTGGFRWAWEMYWGGGLAEQKVSEIAQKLEGKVAGIERGIRSRNKKINFGVSDDFAAGKNYGRKYAIQLENELMRNGS